MKKLSIKKAFTLVEMLVAIGVFSVVMVIGVGAFAHALATQRQVAAQIATESNALTALEEMSREVRTGYLFCHDPDSNNPNATCLAACESQGGPNNAVWTCDGGGTGHGVLDFYNAYLQNVDYKFANNALERSETGPNGTYESMMGSNVKVTYLSFILRGHLEGDQWPPRITILLGVAPNSTDPALANDVINLQTTVSARGIDCASSGPNPC